MSKVCKGICHRFKSEKRRSPMYDFHRRCTKCEMLYDRDMVICPCCKNITRQKSQKRARYIKTTIRIDDIETRHLHSTMLRT